MTGVVARRTLFVFRKACICCERQVCLRAPACFQMDHYTYQRTRNIPSIYAEAKRGTIYAEAKRGAIYAEAERGAIYAEAKRGAIYAEAKRGARYAEAKRGAIYARAPPGCIDIFLFNQSR